MDSNEGAMTAGSHGGEASRMGSGEGGNTLRQLPVFRFPEEIERALLQNEFELFLQPQITLHDFSISGAEVLLRWRHPVYGLVLPGEFLPAAEAGGKMGAIGHWVMRSVANHAATWRRWMGSESRISVNISPAEVRDPRFSSNTLGILGTGCGVELDLAEAAILADPRNSLEVLRRTGIGLALDDFGIGYSSLSSLNEYPFTRLKIGRGFVQRLSVSSRSRAIVRSMIKLAKSLQVQINAKGVESPEQLQYLYENGCDEVQGYFIARPMPHARFEGWAAGFLGKHSLTERDEPTHAGKVLMFPGRGAVDGLRGGRGVRCQDHGDVGGGGHRRSSLHENRL